MAISFVGSAQYSSATNNASDMRMYIPGSAQAGDLLIGFFLADMNSSGTTLFTLSGWTILDRQYIGGTNWLGLVVFYKYASSSESTYDICYFDRTTNNRVTATLAYRGVHPSTPFIGSDYTHVTGTSGTTATTPALNNTNAAAWAVCAFGERTYDTGVKSWSSSQVVEREDVDTTDTTNNSTLGVFDTNGPITTGMTAYSATQNVTTTERYSWIGLLNPNATEHTRSTSDVLDLSDSAEVDHNLIRSRSASDALRLSDSFLAEKETHRVVQSAHINVRLED